MKGVNMSYDTMVKAYQDIIRKEFKTVIVCIENNFRDEYGVLINAIGIPDGQRALFSKFVLDILAPEIEKRGFEFFGVVPYSLEEAKCKFPSVWEDIAARIFIDKILSKLTESKWVNHIAATVTALDSDVTVQIPNETSLTYLPDKKNLAKNDGVYAPAVVVQAVDGCDFGMAA